MKILRISLKNLNSLRGDHVIDLEAEPLASAGIFAITGATGAGKSTILDAITLALFGRSARYGTTPNPEDVMSRHTGDCRAEVLFEIPQGRFTSSWHLNRARSQSDGKLQPAKRFIYDAQGGALAENITQADRKIVELTGLDYDRFLRSVLLAQGEFARFLKARSDERSELLEQLTGTVVYSQLGILAHEEKTRREREFELREQALASVVLLTDDERSARQIEQAEHTSQLATLATDRSALQGSLQRGRALVESLAKAAALHSKHEALAQQTAQHEPEFNALALHRRTDPFMADLSRLEQLSQDVQRLNQQVAEAHSAHLTAREGLAGAFEDALHLTTRLLTDKEEAITLAAQEVSQAEADAAALSEWLTQYPAEKGLQTTLPGLSTGIAALIHRRSEHSTLQRQLESQTADLARFQQTVTEKQSEVTAASTTLTEREQELQAEAEQLQSALAGRTVEALEAVLADDQAEREHLQEIKTLLAQRDDSDRKLQELARDIGSREAPLEQLANEQNQLATMVRQGSDLVTALHENLRKSQMIASFEDHRSQLAHGENCPLCGALDHPFTQGQAQPVSEMTRLRAELDSASSELQKIQLSLETKKYERGKAEQSVTELQKQHTVEQAVFQKLEAQLVESAAELPNVEAVQAAMNNLQRRLHLQEATLKRVHGHENDVTAAEKAKQAQQHEVELTKLRQQAATDDVTRIQQALDQNTEARQRNGADLKEAEQALVEPLAALGLEPPAAGDESALSAALVERRDVAVDTEQRLHELQSHLQTIKTAQEQRQREMVELSQRTEELQAEHRPDPSARVPRRAQTTLAAALTAIQEARTRHTGAQATHSERQLSADQANTVLTGETQALTTKLTGTEFGGLDALRAGHLPEIEAQRVAKLERQLADEELDLTGQRKAVEAEVDNLRATTPPEGEALAQAEVSLRELEDHIQSRTSRSALVQADLSRDDANRTKQAEAREAIEAERSQLTIWRQLAGLIGSHDGKKFRVFAQGLSLDLLIRHANQHLQRLAERYRLRRRGGEALELEIVDRHQANVARPMASLSGGESFLASLALALGLSDLAGRNVRIDSLFIDEGFGSLDADSLDVAVAALEGLRLNQKTVGIISHVDLLKERITTQVQVERGSGGTSHIVVKA